MKYAITLLLAFVAIYTNAQIEYTYDDAGNRTLRELPPPEANRDNDENINSDQVSDDEATGESEVSVAKKALTSGTNGVSIYPNPTKSSIEINLGDSYSGDVSQSFDIYSRPER